MKNTVFLLAGGLAAMVTAQELSDCSRQCLDNMLGLAAELECDSQLQGDVLLDCLCRKQNYAYGVVDCTAQSCSQEESLVAVQAAKNECNRVGVNWEAVFTSPGADPQVSGTVLGTEGTVPQTESLPIPGVTSGVLASTAIGISTVVTSNVPAETSAVGSATAHHSQSGDETTQTGVESDAPEATGDAEATTTGAEGDDSGAIHAAAPVMGVLIAAGVAALLV